MKHEIRGFRGVFSFLSNFYPCTMLFEDYKFTSAEAAFQSAKCYHLSDAIAMQDMTAKEAKRKGRTVRMRKDWEQVKVQVMRDVLRAKFDENPSLKTMLLQTAGYTLIEDNAWHDNFWGDCSCEKCRSTPGQNRLGKLLMELRDLYLNEPARCANE